MIKEKSNSNWTSFLYNFSDTKNCGSNYPCRASGVVIKTENTSHKACCSENKFFWNHEKTYSPRKSEKKTAGKL